ncbi:hypothetical protein BX659_1468 [Orenia metallireducens]|uniref:Uncharacterized protein n=1 Tax=Orenia metallireducens TaxID=1413210 RepID=A0A285IGE2_9FIRM|nr:hypothetical protein [Orenia metallireducens]PRX18102.1 hypothetical protein BX659_1468 [Orenia metallireducens]SNY47045.1 hypothetical protein SAMN06265827_1478 [Orenia metallireducens]
MNKTSEIKIARDLWNRTENQAVKLLLNQFSDECPKCGLKAGRGYKNWDLLVPIEVIDTKHHLVSYRCKSCGKQFKKVEEC